MPLTLAGSSLYFGKLATSYPISAVCTHNGGNQFVIIMVTDAEMERCSRDGFDLGFQDRVRSCERDH